MNTVCTTELFLVRATYFLQSSLSHVLQLLFTNICPQRRERGLASEKRCGFAAAFLAMRA
jgi:hypothetical protein